ncbi:MAG: hypothetical protein ACYC3G_00130 [Minisyncoccota bacterium]
MPDTNYEAEKLEAQKRFEALPETLKKEILADKNVDLIYSICKDYSIPEEKIKHVTMLVGEVFLGYTKPEEIAHELTTYFDIDLQKANFIEIELKQKLFNGLKSELDKVYNPIKTGEETISEEISPTIIKLESEATPISKVSSIPTPRSSEIPTDKKLGLKVSPLTIGNIPVKQTPLNQTPSSAPLSEAMTGEQDKPFIIQTKVEAVKAAIPQFPKETPSLNLKVDPSIIQKSPTIKPISVHLETAQPIQEKKFQMPVIAGQKVFSNAPIEKTVNKQDKPINELSKTIPSQTLPTPTQTNQPKIEIKPKEVGQIFPSEPLNLQGKPIEFKKNPEPIEEKKNIASIKNNLAPIFEEIKIPIQQKTITGQPETATPSLKQISEQKINPVQAQQPLSTPEQPKVVHYSTFKTDLTHPSLAGALGGQAGQAKAASPKAGEPRPTTGREDFINLNTFMRVSGNTVDLRSKSTNNE